MRRSRGSHAGGGPYGVPPLGRSPLLRSSPIPESRLAFIASRRTGRFARRHHSCASPPAGRPLEDDKATDCRRHHTPWVKCRRPLVPTRASNRRLSTSPGPVLPDAGNMEPAGRYLICALMAACVLRIYRRGTQAKTSGLAPVRPCSPLSSPLIAAMSSSVSSKSKISKFSLIRDGVVDFGKTMSPR